MSDLVVSGLVKRRAELAGEIERTQDRLAELVHDLEVIDQAILQFDPGYQVEGIKAKFLPPEDWSKRGEMSRVLMGIMRQAAEPLSTRDITMQLFMLRALNKGDESLVRLMTRRVASSLRDYRTKGVVRSLHGPGMYNLWELAGAVARSTAS